MSEASEGPTASPGPHPRDQVPEPLNGSASDFKGVDWDTLDAQGILKVVARALGRDPANPTAEGVTFDILCLRADLEDALEARRWIPVEERLPEPDIWVAVAVRRPGPTPWPPEYSIFSVGRITDRPHGSFGPQGWETQIGFLYLDHAAPPPVVTHWRPLPEPPKEERA
jgi:hypothetical protein